MDADTIIVGAGLAGLACGLKLQEAGQEVIVVEESSRVGGRVRTDERNGFLLDRGFQVYLTAYPNAGALLDTEALDLRPFTAGALIWKDGGLHRLVDPGRNPIETVATLRAPVGTLSDKWRVYRMRQALLHSSMDEIFSAPEITAEAALRDRWGFSEDIIDGFFRPFIGGVTLDTSLQTSSRFLEFVMRMFSTGDAAVPSAGMQAIPDQLAARFPEGVIRLGRSVSSVKRDGSVELEDGSRMVADAVVIATDGSTASALTDQASPAVDWSSTTCMYFSSNTKPIDEPVLVLNGSGEGIVNNLAVMSVVSPSYAPAGSELISITVLDHPHSDAASLEKHVRAEVAAWFGDGVSDWHLVDIQTIPRALPKHIPPALDPPQRSVSLSEHLFVCGDHRDTASIEGAIVSGQRTADEILAR